MESNDKLKTMNINKEILMTIVRNSGGRLEGDQEILEINEQQLHLISTELTKLFSIHSVVLQSEQLPKNNCTLNRQTCGKGSGCKYPHCHI